MFKSSAERAAERLLKEQLYEVVVNEISNDQIRPGLWGQAIAEAEGDQEKAKAKYLDARVQSLLDERELSALESSAREDKAQAKLAREQEKASQILNSERKKENEAKRSQVGQTIAKWIYKLAYWYLLLTLFVSPLVLIESDKGSIIPAIFGVCFVAWLAVLLRKKVKQYEEE